MEPLLWAIPIFTVTMAFELWVTREGQVKG